MSATIDGKAWSSPAPAALYRSNIVSVAGLDVPVTSSVSFAMLAAGPGTYSVASGNSIGGSAIVTQSAKGYSSASTGGTGSVTITTLTANHVVGTFVFDAIGSTGGATGTVHVTNGKFDITF
ncbi:MAG: hypothetical protein ABJF01_06075 [bacterium]